MCFSYNLSAQSYLSFYNFNHINQNLMVNPASPHNYKMVVGIPGVGGVQAHVNTGSLKLDALATGEDFNKSLDNTIRNLKPNDRINLNQTIDGIFVGFKIKKGYWTVAAQQITDFNMTIPSELIKFLYFGNVGSGYLGNTLRMDNFNIDLNVRNEYSIGYQYRIDSNFIIGGRYKYISGITNAYIKNFQLDLYTDVDEWNITTNVLVNTSGTNTLNEIDSQEFITSNLMSKNTGMGFDLGLYYRINKRFDVSASVLNVGWVTWRKNLIGYTSKGSFDYTGVGVEYPETDFDAGIETILDSLGNSFNFEEISIEEYSTPLPSHFIISTQFYASEKHVFGILYQGSVWNQHLYSNYGIMYNGRYAKWLSVMLGYSIQNNVQNNISIGLSVRIGFFQIYALTDNTFGIIDPTSVSSTNLRAGISLSFINKKKEPK